MTEPRIQSNDTDRWRATARAAFGLENDQLNGPTAQQLKQQQADQCMKAGVRGLVDSFAFNKVGMLAEAVGGVTGGVVVALTGPGLTMEALMKGWSNSVQEGAELNQAYRRDSHREAILWLGNQALGLDFTRQELAKLGKTTENAAVGQGRAHRFITQLAADGTLDEARHAVDQLVRAGQNVAEKHGVTTQQALAARLERDANFKTLYQEPTGAFRLGVESVIYRAQYPKPDAGRVSP